MQTPEIRPFEPDDRAQCAAIFDALPQWFGIEDAVQSYLERLAELRTTIAEIDGEVVGFCAIERAQKRTAEITVMAVAPAAHRRGVGRALVRDAEGWLRSEKVEYLQVKTLSSSHSDESYALTRSFYQALGFVALEEFPTLWGAANPCLQMIKRVAQSDPDMLIEALRLRRHPEGGFFRETWRSMLELEPEHLGPGYRTPRKAGTCILYLLRSGERSAWHRVRSDELWIHQGGDPIELTIAEDMTQTGNPVLLGHGRRYEPQALVPGGDWQTAVALAGPAGYALAACVVVPGFDFEDFELAEE